MDEASAVPVVQQLVSSLLSRDPVLFNSAINANFASGCVYKGRGLKIQGATQIKHAACLANYIDWGRAAIVTKDQVHWKKESSTAIVKTVRYVRPFFFPLFQFTVPTKIELTFHAEKDGHKDRLFCTQWVDEWPTDKLMNTLPIVGYVYTYLCMSVVTALVLWLANVVFDLHSRVVVLQSRTTQTSKSGSSMSQQWLNGFQNGVNLAERAVHGPLHAVERMAQTGTDMCNTALPNSLQLPYPRVYSEQETAATQHSSDDSTELPDLPAQKVAGSPVQEQSDDTAEAEHTAQSSEGDKNESESIPEQPKTQPKETLLATTPREKPTHVKIVVGDTSEGATKIDVITKEVIDIPAVKDDAGSSLYLQLKTDGDLPQSDKITPAGPSKNRNRKKKVKQGEAKKAEVKKADPPRKYSLCKPSNDNPTPSSPKSSKSNFH